MNSASLNLRNAAIVALALLGLTACGSDMDGLDSYINTVKARPGGRIEPLPEITPYEVYTYIADAEGIRSPFAPDVPQSKGNTGGVEINEDRIREHLETFPLDTMRMVGTLDFGENKYGLVQTSNGLIHRVLPGNYMGQNDGRIVEVSESEIQLVEIISDGIGGYVERDAAIGIAD
jgi:type IV pilus assembly protein PilP